MIYIEMQNERKKNEFVHGRELPNGRELPVDMA